jgi:uncharacterized protein
MPAYFLMIFLALFASCQKGQPVICHPNVCVSVEVVTEPKDLEKGLQGHAKLAANSGMLFLFKDNARQSFWMKDMDFSIDMIWMDENRKIVHMEENAPPCRDLNCLVYTPSTLSRYVLEVAAGYAHAHGFKIGDVFLPFQLRPWNKT